MSSEKCQHCSGAPVHTVKFVAERTLRRVPAVINLHFLLTRLITMVASSSKRNVMVWRPSVFLSRLYSNVNRALRILTVTHQGAACDAASMHFGLTIKMIDILIFSHLM